VDLMRRLFLLGAALALLATPAFAGAISTATTTAVQLAAATPGRSARIRAYSLTAAGATTVTFEAGTQTTNPCDTGTVLMTGAMTIPANGSLTAGDGMADLLVAPAGDQLCIVQTGSVQLSGWDSLSVN
jgi:hypothetical protein